ncbi:hypothetical protein DIPPA_28092 [Diplonema papillatum]|nr:hypothetical protein DIPPA_28092 [Diplonema papillatum]
MAAYPNNPKPRSDWGQPVKDTPPYSGPWSSGPQQGVRGGYDMSADYTAMPYPVESAYRGGMYSYQTPSPYAMSDPYGVYSPAGMSPYGMPPYGTRDPRKGSPAVSHHHHHHSHAYPSLPHHHHHHTPPHQPPGHPLHHHHHHHHHQHLQHLQHQHHQHQHQQHHQLPQQLPPHHQQHYPMPRIPQQPLPYQKSAAKGEPRQPRQKQQAPKKEDSTAREGIRSFFILKLLAPEHRKDENEPKIKECIDEYCEFVEEFIVKAENDEELDAGDFHNKCDTFRTKWHRDSEPKYTNWISDKHLRSQLDEMMLTHHKKTVTWKESTRPRKGGFEGGKGGNGVARVPGNRGEGGDKDAMGGPAGMKGKGKGKGSKGDKDREKVSLAGLTFKEGSSKRQQAKKSKENERKKKQEAAEAARVQAEEDTAREAEAAEEAAAAADAAPAEPHLAAAEPAEPAEAAEAAEAEGEAEQ